MQHAAPRMSPAPPRAGRAPSLIASPIASLACVMLLSGCAAPRTSAEIDRQQACSQRADQQFDKQNRSLMSERDQTDTPFSSSGMPGDPTRGLNALYQRDRLVDDCLHADDQPEPAAMPAPAH